MVYLCSWPPFNKPHIALCHVSTIHGNRIPALLGPVSQHTHKYHTDVVPVILVFLVFTYMCPDMTE